MLQEDNTEKYERLWHQFESMSSYDDIKNMLNETVSSLATPQKDQPSILDSLVERVQSNGDILIDMTDVLERRAIEQPDCHLIISKIETPDFPPILRFSLKRYIIYKEGVNPIFIYYPNDIPVNFLDLQITPRTGYKYPYRLVTHDLETGDYIPEQLNRYKEVIIAILVFSQQFKNT